ncbi:MAG: hypothetical protein ACREPM_07140 [Gemmatimonadaceae bacterium]
MRPLSRLASLALAAFVLGIAQTTAGAQTRSTWSLQGSLLSAGLGGSAYSGIDPGVGFEVQARWKAAPTFSLGCGFQGTYHSFTKFQGSVKLQGLFCEPRQIVDIGSESVFPYVSARVSLLQMNQSDSTGFNATATGGTINVGGGVMIPIGAATAQHPTLLEFGGSAGFTQFGDLTSTAANGQSVTRTTGSGWNFVLRVGFAFGL